MSNWIFITSYSGGSWSDRDLYINPYLNTAKVMIYDQIGIDDEGNPEYLEYETQLTIEEALKEVAHNQALTSKILKLLEEHP